VTWRGHEDRYLTATGEIQNNVYFRGIYLSIRSGTTILNTLWSINTYCKCVPGIEIWTGTLTATDKLQNNVYFRAFYLSIKSGTTTLNTLLLINTYSKSGEGIEIWTGTLTAAGKMQSNAYVGNTYLSIGYWTTTPKDMQNVVHWRPVGGPIDKISVWHKWNAKYGQGWK
jgi:hypothetical protein